MIQMQEVNPNDIDFFIRLPLSNFFVCDELKEYKPKSENQRLFISKLLKFEKQKFKDIYIPRCDPNKVQRAGSKIRYQIGTIPAKDSTTLGYKKRLAESYCPERNSRLGKLNEYILFLELLRKQLCGAGWTMDESMYSICDDSIKLGNYKNSEDSLGILKKTGSNKIGQIFDLANTCKILESPINFGGFYIAGGCFEMNSDEFPLASIRHIPNGSVNVDNSVPWVVLEK